MSDEARIERMAEAAREAYAAFRGDKEVVPFRHASSRLAWICVAKAALKALREEGDHRD